MPAKFRRGVAKIFLSWSIALALPAFAQEPAADAVPAVERLKQAALDVNVEIGRLEDNLSCPAQRRLNIYAGTQIEHRTIVDVGISLDERPALHKSFDRAEAASLADDGPFKGGLYKLVCVGADPGPHRLLAEYRFRDADAPADTPPVTLFYDQPFEKAPQTSDIEVSLERSNFLAAPKLSLQVWQALPASAPRASGLHSLFGFFGDQRGEFLSGSADDPLLRNARFLSGVGKYFSALSLLLRLRSDDPNRALAPDFDRELGLAALDFGTLQAASRAYRHALAAGAAPASLVPLRLQLALALYRRGEFAQAASELDKVRPSLRKHDLLQWQDVQSRVLLAQGRLDEVSVLLLHTENQADYDSYVRYYNLGLALIKTGRAGQGATVLDRVGKISTDNTLLAALRDQANLTLGYYFLRQQQGATAIPILQRISAQSPHANRALLGLGWAWLAPPGSKQRKVELGDERTVGPPPEAITGRLPSISDHNLYQRYGLRPFQRAHISSDEDARLKRALVAWAEFNGRDTSDPAVQEGLLAIGLALDQLGAHDGARAYYERGVSALDATGRELEAALSFAAGERWMDPLLQEPADAEPGGKRLVQNLPNPRVAVFLDDVIAAEDFQQALRDYRDLRLLESPLQAAAARLALLAPGDAAAAGNAEALRLRISALLPEVAAEEAAQRARLRAIAVDDLEAQQRQNRKLSEAGHFSLARVYDRPMGGR